MRLKKYIVTAMLALAVSSVVAACSPKANESSSADSKTESSESKAGESKKDGSKASETKASETLAGESKAAENTVGESTVAAAAIEAEAAELKLALNFDAIVNLVGQPFIELKTYKGEPASVENLNGMKIAKYSNPNIEFVLYEDVESPGDENAYLVWIIKTDAATMWRLDKEASKEAFVKAVPRSNEVIESTVPQGDPFAIGKAGQKSINFEDSGYAFTVAYDSKIKPDSPAAVFSLDYIPVEK